MPAPSLSLRIAPDLPSAVPGVWHADALGAGPQAAQPTGHALLDAQLPGGGWPVGALCEVLQPLAGLHEWQLVLPALAQATARHTGAVVAVGACGLVTRLIAPLLSDKKGAGSVLSRSAQYVRLVVPPTASVVAVAHCCGWSSAAGHLARRGLCALSPDHQQAFAPSSSALAFVLAGQPVLPGQLPERDLPTGLGFPKQSLQG